MADQVIARRRRTITIAALAAFLTAIAVWTAPVAQAAVFVVTRFDDPPPNGCAPGDCSPREAVIDANALAGPDTITLGAGTYTLSIPGTAEDAAADGDLDITDPVTIRGTGSGNTIIDGGGATTNERAFHILSSLDISMVTIQNSVSPTGFAGLFGEGGTSVLTMTDAVVSGHTNTSSTGSEYGSGINSEGTLTLTNVISRNNSSPTHCCSGIFHFPQSSTGPFTARNVTSVDNTDMDCCSGMFVETDDPVIIENVNVSRNISSGGGTSSCCTGIFLAGPGTTTIKNATVADNQGQGECCVGIYNEDADVTLENVTVSRNVSDDCCAGITHNATGKTLTATNLTVTGNRGNTDNADPGDDGAGISNLGGTVQLRNSISFGNTVGSPGLGPDCFGSITSQGHNLIGSLADCTFAASTGDIIGQDPKLGPLADNGGPLMTHALLAGSPAINAGDPAPPGSGGTSCAATDARGLPRNCDIGAYELVLCGTVPVNRIGTAGDNTMTGTDGPDGFLAGDGNDAATGLGGDDTFCLEGGDDSASGGGGNDQILGEAGNDTGDGGEGNDSFLGGDGNDVGKGAAGKDLLKGEKGKDRLNGGSGKDKLIGGGGKDRLNCGAGKKESGKGGPGKDKAVKCERGKA